jgi:hypothetical protein
MRRGRRDLCCLYVTSSCWKNFFFPTHFPANVSHFWEIFLGPGMSFWKWSGLQTHLLENVSAWDADPAENPFVPEMFHCHQIPFPGQRHTSWTMFLGTGTFPPQTFSNCGQSGIFITDPLQHRDIRFLLVSSMPLFLNAIHVVGSRNSRLHSTTIHLRIGPRNYFNVRHSAGCVYRSNCCPFAQYQQRTTI